MPKLEYSRNCGFRMAAPAPQWLHSPAGGMTAHTPASAATQNMETPIQFTGLNAIIGTAPRKPGLNENKVYHYQGYLGHPKAQ